MSISLTAIIIAQNEQEMIGDALDSLSFVEQVVVVDNNSHDATGEIARKKGARVIIIDSLDFYKLRDAPLKKIKTEYVLYIDADERVSHELRDEITRVIHENAHLSAYRIPRQNYYLGNHPWPQIEHLERLFRRSSLKGWKGDLHETAVFDGQIGDLSSPIHHFTHRDFSSMVEKTNKWSEIEARLRFESGHPPVFWWRFPRVMLQAFGASYFSQKGWKAGVVGVMESLFQAFSIFITYAKLWELQQKAK